MDYLDDLTLNIHILYDGMRAYSLTQISIDAIFCSDETRELVVLSEALKPLPK